MAATITLGPADGSVRLHTTRTGAAARMGHDLVIEVRRWNATLTATEDETGLASVTASVDPASCEVIEGTGGATRLSDKDKADIKKRLEEKVLDVSRHPQVSFESTAVEGSTIRGQLHLVGATRPWELNLEVAGDRVKARGSIAQTDFGIKPYSFLMGGLRVGDVVGVSIDLRNPRA